MATKKPVAPLYTTARDISFVPAVTDSARVLVQGGWDGGAGIFVELPDGDFMIGEVVDGVFRLASGVDSVYLRTDADGYIKVER